VSGRALSQFPDRAPSFSSARLFFFFFFFNKAQKFVTIIETKENKGEEGEGREGERKGGKTSGRRDVLHRGSDLYTALDLLRSAKLQREAVEWSGGV
jgi:hypothetical protein